MKEVIATALATFFALVSGFFLHRAMTWGALAPAEAMTTQAALEAAVVGGLSDAWIAFLVACLVLPAGAAGLHRQVAWGIVCLVAVAAAGHQAYAEYFRFQIVPFHMSYVTDVEFMKANGRSLLDWRVLTTFVGILGIGAAVLRLDAFCALSQRRLVATGLILGLTALVGHNRNIVLRMRWFVPENLQLNALERLYVSFASSRLPKELTQAELEYLRRALGAPKDAAALTELIARPPPADAEVDELGRKLRHAFAQAREAGRKPLALAVLLESWRPAETGFFAPDKLSLTPHLDALAQRSIVFTNAYGTGSVTRGAQEAVYCAYLGSRDTSLMRGHAIVTPTCLPDLVAKRGDVATFWYHGGEGRFDSQAAFWKERRVGEILSQKDFPDSAPRTGWGVGDLSFLATAGGRLEQLMATTPASAVLGMVLTVTNHIPWRLPDDAPPHIHQLAAGVGHPSWATTAYADEALGRFLKRLEASGLWQDTLLVLVSDHGTSVPPYADIYGADPAASERLQSHVNLIVTGGLVDRVLAAAGRSAVVRRELVSQADVGGFLAYLLGLQDASFLGEALFTNARRAPVLSDLEQGLFSPGTGKFFSNRDVVDAEADGRPEDERLSLLYFRAFLQYISDRRAVRSPSPGL
jgi:hypothetical protein